MAIEIRSLNEHEKGAIRAALTEYIDNTSDKNKAWAHKIIRDEMLDGLLWMKDRGGA